MPENETPGGGRYGPTRRMLTGRRVLEDVRRIYRCLNLRVVSARPCPQLQTPLYRGPQGLSNARLSPRRLRSPLSPTGIPPTCLSCLGRYPVSPGASPRRAECQLSDNLVPALPWGRTSPNESSRGLRRPTPAADPEAPCQPPSTLPKGKRCKRRSWRRSSRGGPARRGFDRG